MKKIFFALLVILISYQFVNAQGVINSIVFNPANPTTNDTIWALVSCTFNNSACNPDALNSGQNGNDINADAIHCLGGTSATCSYTDTFMILPQPVGAYKFYFTLNSGFGGPGCSPGFTSDDVDSSTFNVSLPSGIADVNHSIKNVFANYDLSKQIFSINYSLQQPEKISATIFDVLGKRVKNIVNEESQLAGKHSIPYEGNLLPPGLYLVSVKNSYHETAVKLLVPSR